MKSLKIVFKHLAIHTMSRSSYEDKVLEAVIQSRNVGYLMGSFDIFGKSCRIKFAHGSVAHAHKEGNQSQL